MIRVKYTTNQQKVINHWEGNLQIIACAGSGKTDVITRRIAKLVAMGVQTREIVAFTFTENAAEELKFRIRKHLQELHPGNLGIGDSIDEWKFHPLGYKTQMIFEQVGFSLQRIIIHIQARTNGFF